MRALIVFLFSCAAMAGELPMTPEQAGDRSEAYAIMMQVWTRSETDLYCKSYPRSVMQTRYGALTLTVDCSIRNAYLEAHPREAAGFMASTDQGVRWLFKVYPPDGDSEENPTIQAE